MSSSPVGPYSPVLESDGFVFVSGQIGLGPAGLEAGVDAQVDRAMANLAGQLDTVGLSLRDVVKTTVFLVDMTDYDAMNARYIAAFGEHRPARSAVAVAALPLGALVEIEAIAHR